MPREDYPGRYTRREVIGLLGGADDEVVVVVVVVVQAVQRDNPRRFLAFVPA